MYKVTGVTPTSMFIEVVDVDAYQQQDDAKKLSIGSFIKVSDHKALTVLAIVQSFRIKDAVVTTEGVEPTQAVFVIEAQPVGSFDNEEFRRGGQQIAIPPTDVEVATTEDLKKIYGGIEVEKQFKFGKMVQDPNVSVIVDGDKFFGKHIGVVGSTGSGKSCTVAKLIQEGIKASDGQAQAGVLNNSHVLIFDVHGEYASAFPTARKITVDNLILPYWLMNSEELEEMFIESQEANSHNQISQFKFAVTLNKQRHNETLEKLNYDTPVFFSIEEIHRYIRNHSCATKDAKTRVLAIKERVPDLDEKYQLFESIEFEDKSTGKINGGPYEGEFDRFASRLETKLNDDRLAFLLCPKKPNGDTYSTDDLGEIIRQFTGYIHEHESNVTIIDLSGIPFEVLSIVVSLITRLIFDFCFYFRKPKPNNEEIPFMLVFEEAHRYVPRTEASRYNSVKKSIERVAKEGRKYGISLMIISQRPSEISETIFSQCNNFVAMRLTNPADQQYIKRLLPDSVSAITDSLPILEKREAIVIGDSISVPSWVTIDEITDKPDSNDINFHTEWKKNWMEIAFDEVINRLK